MIKYSSEKEFRYDVEESATPVIVDFYADWCGPCKMIQPELEKLAEEGVKIVKINVDENNHLAERFGVHSIPCMILFADGEPRKTIIGFRTSQQLKALLAEKDA
ncbi:MAG: thioredoxin [Clostridia bacterium]|nr:thioredoxin [Clostridia bacterium]